MKVYELRQILELYDGEMDITLIDLDKNRLDLKDIYIDTKSSMENPKLALIGE